MMKHPARPGASSNRLVNMGAYDVFLSVEHVSTLEEGFTYVGWYIQAKVEQFQRIYGKSSWQGSITHATDR
eukprot:12881642-Prorocentrum_lima.AAC.1